MKGNVMSPSFEIGNVRERRKAQEARITEPPPRYQDLSRQVWCASAIIKRCALAFCDEWDDQPVREVQYAVLLLLALPDRVPHHHASDETLEEVSQALDRLLPSDKNNTLEEVSQALDRLLLASPDRVPYHASDETLEEVSWALDRLRSWFMYECSEESAAV